jgi:uncharacterized protein
MQVKLDTILEEGLELSCLETPQELDLVYPDISFKGGILTQVRLHRISDTVNVSGQIEASVILECGRCARSFPFALSVPFSAVFSPEKMTARMRAKDYRLSTDELELYFYSGETIDLGEFIREQILLSIPMVPYCAEDCRGLCPRCGLNLNLGKCSC